MFVLAAIIFWNQKCFSQQHGLGDEWYCATVAQVARQSDFILAITNSISSSSDMLVFPKICNEAQCFQAPRHFCSLVTFCKLVEIEFVMN